MSYLGSLKWSYAYSLWTTLITSDPWNVKLLKCIYSIIVPIFHERVKLSSWRVKEPRMKSLCQAQLMLKLGRDLNSEYCFSILKLQIFHRTYLYLFMWNTDLLICPIFYWAILPSVYGKRWKWRKRVWGVQLSKWTAISVTVKANADLGHPIFCFCFAFLKIWQPYVRRILLRSSLLFSFFIILFYF